MADLKLSVQAIVGLIFALLITIFGWYLVPALSDILPIDSLKVIYWIGIILFWVLGVIVTPILMIMGGKGNFKGAIFGLISFLGGYVLSILIYYTIGYIIESMDAIWPNSTFVSIGWIAVYMIWILGLIIVPSYLVIKDALSTEEER